jgi:hypothetical protein
MRTNLKHHPKLDGYCLVGVAGKNIMNFTQIGSFEARPMLILVMAKSIKNK